MNPLSINPLFLLAGVAAAAAIGAGGGWTANGWRLGTQIAELKAERSNEVAEQNKAVLDDFVKASRIVNDQADAARLDFSALTTDLAAIRKEFKNANAKPLPVDCRPDDVRMRKLTATVDTVRKAVARQQSGGTVQDPGSP